MKKIIIILLTSFAFLSCEPKLQPDKPDNLIEKDKMTELLYDMYIINSAKGISRNKFEKLGLNPEKYILQKHNIDSLAFTQSNDYYAHDVKTYKKIVENIKNRITSEKDKFTELQKEEKEAYQKLKDSIREARKRKTPNPSIDPEDL